MSGRSLISPVFKTTVVTTVIVGLALVAWLTPDRAEARDSDGSRLGAQAHKLGSTHEDTLAPPSDVADWRYIKVEKSQTITISVSVEPTERSVELVLTRATGDELDTKNSEKGEGTLERELEPGLYYLKVGASAAISYSLTIE